MNVADIVDGLPFELKLIVLEQKVRTPKAHFLKPCKTYNGGLLGEPPHDLWLMTGDLGVEEVSRLSGACETAKIHMALKNASTLVANQDLTPIALNPDMFPINITTRGVPHIKVNMVDDIFCVSSNGRDPWFPGEKFSGGVLRNHEKLSYARRVCMPLPNYDLTTGSNGCQDCGRTYEEEPEAFSDDRLEFCTKCIGLWFALLGELEEVYLIVPGLPRAKKTDKHHLFRYGERFTLAQSVIDARHRGACEVRHILRRHVSADARRTPPHEFDLIDCYSIEDMGPDGPRSFEGNGITLYEAAAHDVPEQAVRLMANMAEAYMRTRAEWTEVTRGTFPARPAQPRVCGGLVEFKFLSYHQGP